MSVWLPGRLKKAKCLSAGDHVAREIPPASTIKGTGADLPSTAAVTSCFLSEKITCEPSGAKLTEWPAAILRAAPPDVGTIQTSRGFGPSGELLTLAGASSSIVSPRVNAIHLPSGDQAISPISTP